MKRASIFIFLMAASLAPGARADYAVLRSGQRLHITSYEMAGSRVRLVIEGGTVEMAADDLVSVEPETVFPAPPAPPAADGPFATLIRDAAKKHGVDEKLIEHLIAVESNFNPRAVSRRQASGLMQLLPQTAARYSVANIFDPAQNIDAGTRYLKELLDRYRGDLKLALAAYNAGPEMVQRYGGIPPFRETQNYVRQILARIEKVQKAQATN
ncbi:MAG TPA: lytic transglycosylase domain-containing protein [Candidatus Sulfotelmatobacter sp.]|nr:lytic transglycosylase domain-containing protein [Candidatus Sulfotelmatobacter sp.]